MTKPQTEEQFPLLLVLVGDQDISQNNKRLFGKRRFDGITSGASTIITEWPNYLSSCWLTALICGLTLFMVSIMFTSCLTYQHHPRLPRCSSDYQPIDNKTIHLVHTSNKWYPHQLKLLENIVNTFPNYQIHIISISNATTTSKLTNQTKFNEKHNKTINKTEDTFDEFINRHPAVIVTNFTYKDIFAKSPLSFNWKSLSNQMKIFAVRVLQLWEFGGASYDLLDHKTPPTKKSKNCTNYTENKLNNYIRRGYKRFETLYPKMVSVDHNGFHMECKIPCHAFFGKIIMKLRKANGKVTPRGILTGPLFSFCKAGAIDKEFCHVKNINFK